MMAADRMPLEALLLIFTLLSSVLFVQAALDIQKKRVMIRKLNMCKGTENALLRWTNVTLNYNEDTKETDFGLKLAVLAEVSDNFSMKFSFWKCDTSGNPDSCEYVLKDYVNKEICKFMVMKNQAWTIFMDHFDKPLSCPVKPGMYTLNAPVRSDFLKYLPVTDAVWKVRLWGYDLQKFISCVDLELQIAPFLGRKRSKGGK